MATQEVCISDDSTSVPRMAPVLPSMPRKSTTRASFMQGARAILPGVVGNTPRSPSKTVAKSWHGKMRRRTQRLDGEAVGCTHLDDWLEDSEVSAHRVANFRTVGKAPIEIPMHPARLTPLRLMQPTPSLPDSVAQDTTCESLARRAHAGQGSAVGEDAEADSHHPPRSFSRHCRRVLVEQSAIEAFDVMSIYLGCEFFHQCSFNFVRELVLAGGPQACNGVCVPPHTNVYTEGDQGHSIYVIARGRAEVLDNHGRNKGTLGPSDYFGQAQVLGVATNRLETVRAMTYLQLLVITHTTFTKVLKRTTAQDSQMYGDAAPVEPVEKTSEVAKTKKSFALKDSSLFHDERRHFETVSLSLYRRVANRIGAVESKGNEKMLDEVGADVSHTERQVDGDRLAAKVLASLRSDMRKCYMMPADKVGNSQRQKQKQNALAKPKNAASCIARREREQARPSASCEVNSPVVPVVIPMDVEDADADEVVIKDVQSPLDAHCLPPLRHLSAVQKYGILRQLRHQRLPESSNTRKNSISGGKIFGINVPESRSAIKDLNQQQPGLGLAGSASKGSIFSMVSVTTNTGGDEMSLLARTSSQGSSLDRPFRNAD